MVHCKAPCPSAPGILLCVWLPSAASLRSDPAGAPGSAVAQQHPLLRKQHTMCISQPGSTQSLSLWPLSHTTYNTQQSCNLMLSSTTKQTKKKKKKGCIKLAQQQIYLHWTRSCRGRCHKWDTRRWCQASWTWLYSSPCASLPLSERPCPPPQGRLQSPLSSPAAQYHPHTCGSTPEVQVGRFSEHELIFSMSGEFFKWKM